MGLFSSSLVPNDVNSVDLHLKMAEAEALFKFKVLLLGAGESGKSTVMKQLKLIHRVPVETEEKTRVAKGLHLNVMDCMKSLITACNTFSVPIPEKFNDTIKKIKSFDEDNQLNPEFAGEIKAFWASEAIKTVYEKRDKFHLLDSCQFYMDNIDRFAQEGFLPTEEDLIMARVKTTGIVERDLEQKIASNHKYEPSTLQFKVIDVGGQRNERRKWFNCFDDVKCILFIVNLAGYNQVLYEDYNMNRLTESLKVFQDIAQNHMFRDTPIFIFLNKKDLFETMIREKDLSDVFPDYTGGPNLRPAMEHIKEEFRKRCPIGKEVEFEEVSARVKGDIRNAFGTVKKTLYNDNRTQILEKVSRIYKESAKMERSANGTSGCGGCLFSPKGQQI